VTRRWLNDHRAAIISVASIRWGTLVLSAGPDDAEPQAVLVPGVKGADISGLLVRHNMEADSSAWTDLVLAAAVSLSATLVPTIRDRLMQLTETARVLHVIPNGALFDLPWAALHLSPGQPIGGTVPLAVGASADLLLHRAARAPLGRERSCLAVASGRDQTGFDFRAHLAQVGAAGWTAVPMELFGSAAQPETIADLAVRHDVLFVASHGEVSADTEDVLAASVLHLADGKRLTARDVAAWRMKPGLVFLNACQSGRFRRASRTELGGFPRAFLTAGSRTVIAPLVHVDPVQAGNLAALFFTSWLAGSTAGEALKEACDALRRKGASPRDWSTYAQYGDAFL
jgi:CHAT domain-containing protein